VFYVCDQVGSTHINVRGRAANHLDWRTESFPVIAKEHYTLLGFMSTTPG
jgi:hypothetical protein